MMLIYALLAIGLVDSLYLVNINLNQQLCLINAPCLSEYSLVFAILGSIWFSSGFIINYFLNKNNNNSSKKQLIMKTWAFVGFAGIAFFVSIMILDNYFCPYCSLAHAVGGAAAILSLRKGN